MNFYQRLEDKQKRLTWVLDLIFNHCPLYTNKFRPLIFLLFFSLQTSFTYSQNSSSLTINSISFEGIQKNKDDYLLLLIKLKPGDTISIENVNSSIQTLRNTSGVSNVSTRIDTTQEKINITYIIDERQTTLPVINFGGIKDNLWFSLGFIDNNWRGKGQTLLAYYQYNDKRHSGQVFFRNPRYKGSMWGHSLSISRWASLEPLFFDEGPVTYLYDNHSLGATIIRNFSNKIFMEFGATYFIENYKQAEEQFLTNPPGPKSLLQNKWLTKLIYNQDFLNYQSFYIKGYDFNLTLQNVYTYSDQTTFNSLQLQSRFYLKVGQKINIASRLKFGISTNNDSPFAPFVIDSHINIRGVGNRIDRGTAQIIFNSELRYTLTHIKYWASQIIAFSDMGTWRNPGGSFGQLFQKEQFRHFIGLGFRVIYQKVFGATLRVDYGVDIYNTNQQGIVIGLGQYF